MKKILSRLCLGLLAASACKKGGSDCADKPVLPVSIRGYESTFDSAGAIKIPRIYR